VRALIQRDVRDIPDIERLEQMPRLLRVLAHHSGQLTNFTQLGGQHGLDNKTTKKYDGEHTVSFGDRMFGAPVSCVWG